MAKLLFWFRLAGPTFALVRSALFRTPPSFNTPLVIELNLLGPLHGGKESGPSPVCAAQPASLPTPSCVEGLWSNNFRLPSPISLFYLPVAVLVFSTCEPITLSTYPPRPDITSVSQPSKGFTHQTKADSETASFLRFHRVPAFIPFWPLNCGYRMRLFVDAVVRLGSDYPMDARRL